jgi:hypothetical protein
MLRPRGWHPEKRSADASLWTGLRLSCFNRRMSFATAFHFWFYRFPRRLAEGIG